MNNDIRPPVQNRPKPEVEQPTETVQPPVSEQAAAETAPPDTMSVQKKRRINWWWVLVSTVAVAVALASAVVLWYFQQLQPVVPGSNQLVSVTVPAGTNGSSLANLLSEKSLIRDPLAFQWYLRLSGASGKLQAGPYKLSQGSSVPTIVEAITSGDTETFTITFLPGDTLAKHRKTLLLAGYSEADVDAALKKQYDHPLFATKPESADLEGYIYGETYQFAADATVEQVLERTFDQFYKVIEENNLVNKYKQQGLTLYEGITLASIIQREVYEPKDQAQVAQVFLLRLKKDMQLGSDVTYQYIADKTGQARDVNLDSPYNTRRYSGLPPGPISSPGEGALIAVGNPAKGNYLYFLSGDDDKTYFARTNAQHEANIEKHCQKKCQIL